jgi:hypothetical protein
MKNRDRIIRRENQENIKVTLQEQIAEKDKEIERLLEDKLLHHHIMEASSDISCEISIEIIPNKDQRKTITKEKKTN